MINYDKKRNTFVFIQEDLVSAGSDAWNRREKTGGQTSVVEQSPISGMISVEMRPEVWCQ